MQDYQRTIISQYGAPPTVQALLDAINQWFDPTANIDAFYDLVWNVATAEGYGLDVWGRIVGVQRNLRMPVGSWFGFRTPQDPQPWKPFNYGVFFNGQLLTHSYTLDDDTFRRVIMAKAATNITDCSIGAMNVIAMTLFPSRGNVWVQDNLNMSMVWRFDFSPALTPVEFAIILQLGCLPRPTGVQMTIQTSPTSPYFLLGVGGDQLLGVGLDQLTSLYPP